MRRYIAIGLVLTPLAAEAYVGPGLGVGIFGVLLGALMAVALAFMGVIWYPLKRLVQKVRPEPAHADRDRIERGRMARGPAPERPALDERNG